ncbi:unnamed protein product [Brassica napus]|uniref:(rape) hypothetical protein n=1 Tax=Brassica napus TaxID=3708 RepID=A0A816Y2U0_BRANA|nr:unnamed protein product [Brassica napus]
MVQIKRLSALFPCGMMKKNEVLEEKFCLLFFLKRFMIVF